MTVKLLSAWGAQPPGTLFASDSATESAMIATKVATATLTGGVAWIPNIGTPNESHPIDLGAKTASEMAAINVAQAAGLVSYPARSTAVVDGKVWTNTGTGTAAAFAVDGAGNPISLVGTPKVGQILTAVVAAGWQNAGGIWTRAGSDISGATGLTRLLLVADSPGPVTYKSSNIPFVPTAVAVAVADLTDGYDIWLLAGQSNQAGRGIMDPAIDTPDANVFQFGGLSSNSATYRLISQALDPLKHPDTSTFSSSFIGPGMAFAKRYCQATGRKVLLVPVAFGGTAMVGGTTPRWSPTAPGDLYTSAIDQANRAVSAAQAVYASSKFVGTYWVQGESDGDNNVTQAAYLAALTTLIAGFRSGITGGANSLFLIGSMVPDYIATHANYAAIDAAHKQAIGLIAKTAFVTVPTGHVGTGGYHYDAEGYRIGGALAADAVPAAIANAGSGVAPPGQLTGLTLGTTTSSSQALTWNLPSGGAPTDYIVEYKASSSSTWLTFADGVSTTRAATVTGLAASTAYDFRVSASNSGGTGAVSSTVTATTSAAGGAVTYDFEADTVGAAPANTTPSSGGATGEVVTDVISGMTGKYIHFMSTPVFSGATALDLTLFSSKADQTVTWDRGQVAAGASTVRQGMTLRAGSVSGGGTYPTIRTGYIFLDRGTGLAIYKLVGTALTQLGTTLTVVGSALRKFRASVIGTTVMFEYSDDVGETWVTAFSVTDSSITAAGGVQWVTGFGTSQQDGSYIDNVVYS